MSIPPHPKDPIDPIREPLADLVGRLGGLVYEIDGERFGFTYVSPSAEALLGYPIAEWHRPGFWPSRVHPEDVARTDQFWLTEAAARRAHAVEYRMIASDGRSVWIHDRATPIERDGRIGFVGVMLDVTAVRQGDQALRVVGDLTAHHVGDRFLSMLAEGVARELDCAAVLIGELAGTEGGRVDVVAAAGRGGPIAGFDYDLSRSPCALVARGDVLHVRDGVRERFPEAEFLRTIGATGYLGHPLLDDEQRPIGVFALIDDRPLDRSNRIEAVLAGSAARVGAELVRRRSERARQRLQSQLLQAQKMEAIGTLAGGIAHDFNNILMGLRGNAEIAAEELGAAHPVGANLKEILRAAARASEVVQRILTFSRAGEPARRPMALEPVVDEAIALLRASLPATLEIRIESRGKLPPVLGDPSQIQQVLMNLATNGAYAMAGQRGVLSFELAAEDVERAVDGSVVPLPPGRYARVSVRDTGTGIPEERLGRIFEPFFTTKPPGEGTGLGLAVVHGIMRDHEGTVVVRSRLGSGTTFDLYLPIAQSEPTPAAPEPPARAGGGQRVLFIDDEPAIVGIGRRMLERLGYRVTAFESAPEALTRFEQAPGDFDLVITDLTMPELTGLEIARRIRTASPGTPIVVTTGNVNLIDTGTDQALYDEVLPKPFAIARLAHVLGRLAPLAAQPYFSYGANMDRAHMARTAPTATWVGPATLADHRVVIASAGYATLEPRPGTPVHGILWLLPPDAEAALDRFEALPDGLYRKGSVMVRTEAGEPRAAMIYLATDPRPGVAPIGYLEQILRAGRAHGFPAPYLDELGRLPESTSTRWTGEP